MTSKSQQGRLTVQQGGQWSVEKNPLTNDFNVLYSKDTKGADMLTNDLLENNIVRVLFTKKDGTPREMLCTRNKKYAPATTNARTNPNANILTVWDLDNAGWRSINKETVTSVEVTPDRVA